MLRQLRRRVVLSVISLFALAMVSLPASAELVVIANPQNPVEQITRTDVINIFLGNSREFPNGLSAKPIDLPATVPEKGQFYRALVNKDLDQMAAYWSRLVFAGNTSPPVQVSSVNEALRLVASNRSAIAYVERKSADGARVKIIFAFP